VEKDDPIFAVATIFQAYLEEGGKQIEASIREHLGEFEASVAKVQTRAGQLVAAEFNDRITAIRGALQQARLSSGSSRLTGIR
jgi:uncharacterized protein YicC (UPF0701 family)